MKLNSNWDIIKETIRIRKNQKKRGPIRLVGFYIKELFEFGVAIVVGKILKKIGKL